MKKYISCLLLLLALALPMLVMEAQAATTGTCGENVTWSLDGKGTLTISGTGDMADYASASDVPWYASRASVKSVVIKDGVTTIGDRAFYNCAVLTDVTVGSGVKTVGTFAFQGCSALGEIVLPAAVTALEDSAFRACTALETMTFGGDAPALGSNVFTDAASDMTVRYYEGSTGFDAAPWTDYYHETMHVGQWVVDTEPGCTTLGSKHIDCTYCETTITETIPSRHDYVDGVCSVCQGIQLLGSGSCGDDLTWELDIRGVLTISGTGSMEYYYSWPSPTAPWFGHEENIISVIIEEGVTSIGSCAFEDCSSLKEVTIPDSVTEIGFDAFDGCSSLKSVTIGDSVTTIGNYAFRSCSSLESITIPDSVTEIGSCAFENCSSLESVTIPDSVTTIGDGAFRSCSSLTDVYITDIAAWMSISSAYYDANPLRVNDLDKKLYLNGNLVTNLVIPEGVASIGEAAFSSCSLVSVTIPDSVTTIGEAAFRGCSSLESVTIPDSVTLIGEFAFSFCSSLVSITIPDSVNEIGEGAFFNCTSLTTVHYAGTEAQKADILINSGNLELEEATWHYECNGVDCPKPEIPPTEPEATEPAMPPAEETNPTTPPTEEGEPVENPFADVAEDAYYFAPVLWAVENGITNGLSADTFGPDATCTRGQIVTFLWRANGSPEPTSSTNPFWDVTEGDYFYKAVLWAVGNGITSGMGDGSFAPGAPCTRGQVATFLWRACGQPAPSGTNIFTDIAPGAYYYDAVLWAVENGITNGMGDGTFAPDAPCTRGQIVTFLYRAMA